MNLNKTLTTKKCNILKNKLLLRISLLASWVVDINNLNVEMSVNVKCCLNFKTAI